MALCAGLQANFHAINISSHSCSQHWIIKGENYPWVCCQTILKHSHYWKTTKSILPGVKFASDTFLVHWRMVDRFRFTRHSFHIGPRTNWVRGTVPNRLNKHRSPLVLFLYSGDHAGSNPAPQHWHPNNCSTGIVQHSWFHEAGKKVFWITFRLKSPIGFVCTWQLTYVISYWPSARAVLGEYRPEVLAIRTEPLRRGPYKKVRGPIFSQYGPEQTRSIRDYYTTFSVRKDENGKCNEYSAREDCQNQTDCIRRISCTTIIDTVASVLLSNSSLYQSASCQIEIVFRLSVLNWIYVLR